MKILLLGTGAGEGYPGRWCECPHCSYARAHGGKNIRANSCALIDGTLLVDMGPACFDAAARLGVSLAQVTGLLITHPHADHLFTPELRWRMGSSLPQSYATLLESHGPRFTAIPDLTVYGGPFAGQAVENFAKEPDNFHLTFHPLEPGQPVAHGAYTVTAVAAQHAQPGFTNSYIVQNGGKTLLYALDTGSYAPDMQALLASHHYDLIVMEGTGGLRTGDVGHMNLAKNCAFRDFLLSKGCIQGDTPFVLSHMSPHWTPPHDWYCAFAEKEGMTVGYDGLEIEC